MFQKKSGNSNDPTKDSLENERKTALDEGDKTLRKAQGLGHSDEKLTTQKHPLEGARFGGKEAYINELFRESRADGRGVDLRPAFDEALGKIDNVIARHVVEANAARGEGRDVLERAQGADKRVDDIREQQKVQELKRGEGRVHAERDLADTLRGELGTDPSTERLIAALKSHREHVRVSEGPVVDQGGTSFLERARESLKGLWDRPNKDETQAVDALSSAKQQQIEETLKQRVFEAARKEIESRLTPEERRQLEKEREELKSSLAKSLEDVSRHFQPHRSQIDPPKQSHLSNRINRAARALAAESVKQVLDQEGVGARDQAFSELRREQQSETRELRPMILASAKQPTLDRLTREAIKAIEKSQESFAA